MWNAIILASFGAFIGLLYGFFTASLSNTLFLLLLIASAIWFPICILKAWKETY